VLTLKDVLVCFKCENNCQRFYPCFAASVDFTPISAVSTEVVLDLNSTQREACFDVGIIDDNEFEEVETFEVFLSSLYGDRTDVDDVSIDPSRAVVTIRDNEAAVFVGFEDVMVDVQADIDLVTLCAAVNVMGEDQVIEDFSVRVNVLLAGKMC